MNLSERPAEKPVDVTTDALRPQAAGTSVLLGLFILGQLAFLFAGNFLGMLDHYARTGFPERIKAPLEQAAPAGGHLWRLNETVYTFAWYWAQASGQPQNWGLFAPVGTDCAFPALQLRWDVPVEAPPMLARHLVPLAARDPVEAVVLHAAAQLNPRAMPFEPELILSENEPRDLHRYVRVGRFRLRRLEGSLLPYLPVRATPEKTQQDWRERIESHVRQHGPLIATYCRFRLDAATRLADGNEPAQVLLLMRRYRIRPPGDNGSEQWTGPEITPIARWQPRRTWGLFAQPVEWYNPETERFELIAK